MATQDKKTALNAISQAIDEDIENIIEGKEIVIPETEDTCFRQEQVYTNLMSRINSKGRKFSWMKIAAVLLPFLILNIAFWVYSDIDDNRIAAVSYTHLFGGYFCREYSLIPVLGRVVNDGIYAYIIRCVGA